MNHRTSRPTLLLLALFAIGINAMSAQKEVITAGAKQGAPFSPAVKAGEYIYLSGMLSTDDGGRLIPGDVKEQTRRVLENISKVLDRAGSSLQQAVSLQVYLKNAADFQAMNEVYRGFWKEKPPARTTIAAGLAVPGALVEISAIAVPNGAERVVVHPEAWKSSPNPYSYAIRSGSTLFLSGLVARNPQDNSLSGTTVQSQTKTIMDNAGAILAAAGMSHADIVSSKVFITDITHFQGMNETYRGYFTKDPPARATVVTPLMTPDYVVEITMVAVKSGDRTALTTPQADGTPGRVNPNLSSAVRTGNRLFLSGMLGIKDTNKGDAAAQTRETLAAIGRTLKMAGFEWRHVVDGTVYLTDMRHYANMNQAYREVFQSGFPARATVETALVAPEGLVEIMFLAIKD